jgi:two-component system, chemotaxis family, sensor kinase CheA
MGEFDDVIAEFLIESREGLDQLDRDLVALEDNPDDRELLARVFRCFHTVKGTSGFLGFGKLELLTHAAENLLSRMRDGTLTPNGNITNALLETVDATRKMLVAVEATGTDGDGDYSELTERLRVIYRGDEQPPSEPHAPEHAAHDAEAEREFEAEPEPEPVAMAAVIVPPPTAAAIVKPPPPAAPAAGLEAPPKAAAPARQDDAAEPRSSGAVPENVRVDLGLLDKLVDLAGELVLTRNHIVQLAKVREDAALGSATQRLNYVTAQLQDGIMRMRMQPVSTLFSKFPRVVRDLARSCRKLVRLELDGRDTELDKSLIETIKDPLVHLLRNCVDHGIEPPETRSARGKHPEGRIVLRAYHQNGLVHIEVADDGGGIALDRVKAKGIERGLVSVERAASMSDSEIAGMIFLPGFSTADQVTNVSGRGVGMDVVKTNVEQVGGTVDVTTRAGLGTTFTLKIPLTLAIVPALIVRCAANRYAIPQVNVVELLRLDAAKQALEWIHGAPVFRLRGKLLPVVFLEEAFGGHISPTPANDSSLTDDGPSRFLAVVQGSGRQFGLVVDAVLDQQEIVVKPLPKLLADIRAFAGATLLGDGRVALILDILGIAQRARLVTELREDEMIERARAEVQRHAGQRTLLLLQGPDDARLAVPLDEVSRLETIDIDSIESGGQHHVVQYRGEIMPLLRASELLPERRSRPRSDGVIAPEHPKTLSVVVLGAAGRSMGLVVDDVLDVVETYGEMKRFGCRQGVVGTLVVQDRVTEVLDLVWIMNAAGLSPEAQSATG